MNDIEKILTEILATLDAKDEADDRKIETQEQVIVTANDVIEQCKDEKETRKTQRGQFQMLFNAVKAKAQLDCESLAEFYISDRTDEDIDKFSSRTGIGLPQNELEAVKEAAQEEAASAA